MSTAQYVMKLTCQNRRGIVAAVADFLLKRDFNILESAQFDDRLQDKFFMRVVFDRPRNGLDATALGAEFVDVAKGFGMDWSIRDSEEHRRVIILVSKFDHCLVDLLYRQRIGELPMTVVAIVSNHPQDGLRDFDLQGIPFHYLPLTKHDKVAQEQKLLALVDETRADLIVLARYMQIFSDEMTVAVSGRCINIHHSFLPGFKGAKPYHQAHSHGVKLIGATAHYVTGDLDEGPIIDQDVERISHTDSPESLIRKGRDIERRVLSRAVRFHLEDRTILNGKKTVVFAD